MNFNKDTLFNHLPQEIKSRIIELRNLSQIQHPHSISHPLKPLGHISIPSSRLLQEEYEAFGEKINMLGTKRDVSKYFSEEVKEFNNFVEIYKLNINNTDIIGELEKTIQMIEAKVTELTKNE